MIVECPGCQCRYDVTGRPPGTRARCRCGTVFELPEPAGQAGLLACPKCGGDVAATNHACEYCGVQLLVRACPRCFARIFHGAKHCCHCGAQSVVPARAEADGTPARLACPRCEVPLVGRLVDEVLIDECPDCHGVWVDMVALDRILSERRQARAEGILGPAQGTEPPPQLASSGRVYIRCPECENMMNRRNFARGSGVIVDVCRPHGTWFDGGELPAVVDFAMKGGLERAARKDAARLAEEGRRQLARARMTAAAAAAYQPAPARDYGDTVAAFGSLLGRIGSILVGK